MTDGYVIEKCNGIEKKRPAKEVLCSYCGKNFLKATRFIRDKNYCCREHQHLALQKRVKVKCAYCGKEKEIKQSIYDKNKTKTFFCCREHQNEAQKADSGIDYICNYLNGVYSYRNKALEIYPNECAGCGYDKVDILIVHHIDGNREHNEKENWILLCRNCHYAIHNDLAILENRKFSWKNRKKSTFFLKTA